MCEPTPAFLDQFVDRAAGDFLSGPRPIACEPRDARQQRLPQIGWSDRLRVPTRIRHPAERQVLLRQVLSEKPPARFRPVVEVPHGNLEAANRFVRLTAESCVGGGKSEQECGLARASTFTPIEQPDHSLGWLLSAAKC